MKRREEDKCLVKRLYNKFTPYVQFGGWFTLFIGSGFTFYALAKTAWALDGRVTELEKANRQMATDVALIRQQGDLMIQFFGIK